MTQNTPRYKKIRNIVLECATYKNGVALAVRRLNDNGFTAPCGRKHRWTENQVKQIIRGEICEAEDVQVSSKITKSQHAAIKKSGKKISVFIREAIEFKLNKEGLI